LSRDAAYLKQIPGPTAERYFFDNPLTREVSEFQQSGALTNIDPKPGVPPTPVQIKEKHPHGDELSTLSRLIVQKNGSVALGDWTYVGEGNGTTGN